MQYVSDCSSYDLSWHNLVAIVPVVLEGIFSAHAGRLDIFIVLEQGPNYLGVIDN